MVTSPRTKARAIKTAVIGVVIATISFVLVNINATPAVADTCPAYQLVGIRGSGETNASAGGYGSTVDTVRAQVLRQRVDGVAKLRVLQLGIEEGDSYQIISGLQGDEIVATSNLNELYEGAKVAT